MIKCSYWLSPAINLGPNAIIKRICNHFEVTIDDIKKKNRSRKFTEARSIIAYFLRIRYKWTLQKIADFLDRDHATIIHYNKRVSGFMDVDQKYSELIKSFG